MPWKKAIQRDLNLKYVSDQVLAILMHISNNNIEGAEKIIQESTKPTLMTKLAKQDMSDAINELTTLNSLEWLIIKLNRNNGKTNAAVKAIMYKNFDLFRDLIEKYKYTKNEKDNIKYYLDHKTYKHDNGRYVSFLDKIKKKYPDIYSLL